MQTKQIIETTSATGTHGKTTYGEPETTLRKRIGSTTYVVSVHFSKTSKETMEDKIFRLIEREVRNNA